jgi:hypothetical protein
MSTDLKRAVWDLQTQLAYTENRYHEERAQSERLRRGLREALKPHGTNCMLECPHPAECGPDVWDGCRLTVLRRRAGDEGLGFRGFDAGDPGGTAAE